ncbi:hypothetical protein [Ectobacillus ponti]|uniref:Uncharacterized protein n=1 Tax=Ectobacillus ponti TaxID=2961894 RepID=A0AA41XC20_9BACI|nr:hypothetical protein [Ectobacillus ponti]MCP8970133.1 hypothetical protein [Ectobacillus ponti]
MGSVFASLALLVLTLADYAVFHEDSQRWQWFKQRSKASRMGILGGVLVSLFVVNLLIYWF